MRSYIILSIAVLLVCVFSSSFLVDVFGGNHKHNHNIRSNTPSQSRSRPIRHTQQQRASQYSSIQAYFEEPLRPPRPLYEAQYDIEDFHTNGGYDAEMENVIANAQIYAQSLIPTNSSVWVFDVDETSLSGYSEMLSIGLGGWVPKLSHAWILNGSAPAISQTLNFYNQLISSGFRVIFLTGRRYDEHDATALNLRNVGYTTFDTLITRLPTELNSTATVYKSQRRTILVEQEGYDIVGCVGDQWSDLHGPYTGFKVKLPNYIYFLP